MRLLITGGSGQLGTCIRLDCDRAGIQYAAPSHDGMDITCLDDVRCGFEAIIADGALDAVIHTAAMTAVDECERDPDRAWSVNANATTFIAEQCAGRSIPLLYVSTDYVFDGVKAAPYEPDDSPAPVNVYGRTKHAGELAVRTLCEKYWIARVSWLFSGHGTNYPSTIPVRARRGESLKAIADRVGSPTYAPAAAGAIRALVESEAPSGIYHVTHAAETNWYEFARLVLHVAGIEGTVEPILADTLGLPAIRPPYSVMGNGSLTRAGIVMQSLENAVREFVATDVG